MDLSNRLSHHSLAVYYWSFGIEMRLHRVQLPILGTNDATTCEWIDVFIVGGKADSCRLLFYKFDHLIQVCRRKIILG